MTIDVGYAHLDAADGVELDFVDVPGHDRLVGNMLVGAGEIDAALLVVAADDGPNAQTLEHLALLDALGIDDGLAVVTKVDLVDDARRARSSTRAAARWTGRSLAGVPVLAVSSTTGAGIDDVRARPRGRSATRGRDGRVAAAPSRPPTSRSTGSSRSRAAAPSSPAPSAVRGWIVAPSLRLVPGDGTARVREVQVHGASVEVAGPGRTALQPGRHRGRRALRAGRSSPPIRPSSRRDRMLVRLPGAAPGPGARRASIWGRRRSTRPSAGAAATPSTSRVARTSPRSCGSPSPSPRRRATGSCCGGRPVRTRSSADRSSTSHRRAVSRDGGRRRNESAALAAAVVAGDAAAAAAARLELHGALAEADRRPTRAGCRGGCVGRRARPGRRWCRSDRAWPTCERRPPGRSAGP